MSSASNRGRRFPVETLTADEFSQLLDACGRRSPTSLRNRAILVVMYRAGLRCAEALSLEVRDIDRERNLLNVRCGKNSKQRYAAIDTMALDVIDRWLDARDALGIRRAGPAFCAIRQAERGNALDTSQMRHMMKRLALRAGIEKRVHPHSLRHSFATDLAMERQPMHLIQSALGHENLGTTQRYLRKVAPVELGEAMRDRTWGAVAATAPTPARSTLLDGVSLDGADLPAMVELLQALIERQSPSA